MPPPISDAYMGGGDFFRPRDFLKFGQLFLSGGRWNGMPVIDAAWLTQVSTKRSYMEQDGGDYGYGWHLADYAYHGRMFTPSMQAATAGSYCMFS